MVVILQQYVKCVWFWKRGFGQVVFFFLFTGNGTLVSTHWFQTFGANDELQLPISISLYWNQGKVKLHLHAPSQQPCTAAPSHVTSRSNSPLLKHHNNVIVTLFLSESGHEGFEDYIPGDADDCYAISSAVCRTQNWPIISIFISYQIMVTNYRISIKILYIKLKIGRECCFMSNYVKIQEGGTWKVLCRKNICKWYYLWKCIMLSWKTVIHSHPPHVVTMLR